MDPTVLAEHHKAIPDAGHVALKALGGRMSVFSDVQLARDALQGGAVAIGNFDGVHRGHRALLDAARALAPEGKAGALTFRPHPVKVLAPHLAPPLILTYDEKIAALFTTGVHHVVEIPFDREFAARAPESFVDDTLIRGLGVAHVVVGADFSYGKGGVGKVPALRDRLAAHGANLVVVDPVMEGGLICSSSKIRAFLLEGRIESAALLLGHAYALTGVVEPGDMRGRTMGFRTANIATERELIPKVGVYATFLIVDGERHASVTNIGLRPTFAGSGVRIEAHMLDANADLYGRVVALEFVTRIRDEQKFASADALRDQIAADVDVARAALAAAG